MADAIRKLHKAVLKARADGDMTSRTAKLFDDGRIKISKKLVEEASEVSLECVAGNLEAVIHESVDLLYNWVVVLAEMGIKPGEIWDEMARREELLGIAGKLPKSRSILAEKASRPAGDNRIRKH